MSGMNWKKKPTWTESVHGESLAPDVARAARRVSRAEQKYKVEVWLPMSLIKRMRELSVDRGCTFSALWEAAGTRYAATVATLPEEHLPERRMRTRRDSIADAAKRVARRPR